ncbi:MAG: MarR family winged helix-turn-helix transcriptional regulator [Campylobacteraceae bacterium]|jgi:DNA-binding MarR family transcriptional regulator|nr:MarR family winged helix-turn-helix transcriptional regulator [Campylobacteraceae bacterium]
MDIKTAAEALEQANVIIHQITGKIIAKYDKQYSRQYPIHHIQALIWLKNKGKRRLKDIAVQTGISSSSLCVMFNDMEKNDLVLREIDKNDRRNTYYSLSENGMVQIDRIMRQFKEVTMEALKPLNEDEISDMVKSLNAANQILEKIYKGQQ